MGRNSGVVRSTSRIEANSNLRLRIEKRESNSYNIQLVLESGEPSKIMSESTVELLVGDSLSYSFSLDTPVLFNGPLSKEEKEDDTIAQTRRIFVGKEHKNGD